MGGNKGKTGRTGGEELGSSRSCERERERERPKYVMVRKCYYDRGECPWPEPRVKEDLPGVLG